ncbi:hypothetical protein LINPERHAP1_LOCUS7477 [Linum perenne]
MDIRLPLKRGKKIVKPGGDWIIARFRYEKLPTFCFICGRMGHIDRHCEIYLHTLDDQIVRRWDMDLRAPPRKSNQLGGEQWLVEEETNVTVRASKALEALKCNLGASRWTSDLHQIPALEGTTADEADPATIPDDRKRPRAGSYKAIAIDRIEEDVSNVHKELGGTKGIQDPTNSALAGLCKGSTCPSK